MRVTPRWLVALVLATSACGSSGDSGGSTDEDAAGTDTNEGDVGSDTRVPSDSTAPLDTTGTDTTGTDAVALDTASTDTGTDAALGPYPAGPFGKNAGDVIANFHWEGYHNDVADVLVNTKPYGKYSMDDARLSGRRYALLHVTEFF